MRGFGPGLLHALRRSCPSRGAHPLAAQAAVTACRTAVRLSQSRPIPRLSTLPPQAEQREVAERLLTVKYHELNLIHTAKTAKRRIPEAAAAAVRDAAAVAALAPAERAKVQPL